MEKQYSAFLQGIHGANQMADKNQISRSNSLTSKLAFILPVAFLLIGISSAAGTGTPMSTPNLMINSTSFGNGNIITLNAFVTGGKGPYTYNFIIENASTGSVLISSGLMVSSNTFSIAANPYLNGGDIAFVGVTDGSNPAVSLASPQVGFSVNASISVLSTPSVSSNSSSNNSNQTSAISAPPGSTNAIGAGIVVIILITVIGIFMYGRKGKK